MNSKVLTGHPVKIVSQFFLSQSKHSSYYLRNLRYSSKNILLNSNLLQTVSSCSTSSSSGVEGKKK
jgi:hypothetical protein